MGWVKLIIAIYENKRVGVTKKSSNKWGYILRPFEGNFGSIPLEEATQQAVIAPEMPKARRQKAMPKAKALKFNNRMKQVAVKWPQIDKWSPKLIRVQDKETGLCPYGYECIYK